jgi:hypothetical protein
MNIELILIENNLELLTLKQHVIASFIYTLHYSKYIQKTQLIK